ncbi:MAG: DUF1653 domain-containing protein [Lachnospiraceae bacterium]
MEREIPQPGQFYRHFKNKLYQIIAIATHSETGNALVIYQALYGDFQIYARPLEMFLSPVDKVKYPDAKQYWRFQRVTFASAQKKSPANPNTASAEIAATAITIPNTLPALSTPRKQSPARPQASASIEDIVTSYINANSAQERLHILEENKDICTNHMLDSMAYLIDHTLDGKTVSDKYEDLHNILQTLVHFENSRLR